MIKIFFSTFFYISLSSLILAGHPITIDGLFDDWEDVPITYQDTHNDDIDADFSIVKVTNDSEFIFLYVKFHEAEFLMQNWNNFHLYIDADNNFNTGKLYHGIGADLIWCFGERSGLKIIDGVEEEIYQNDLKLRIAPTVTSGEFEIGIDRNSEIITMNNSQEFYNGKIVFSEFNYDTELGDLLPNESGGIPVSISENLVPDVSKISLQKLNDNAIRIISYNTLNEGILDEERKIYFKRIIQSVNPDIIALQEHGEWEEILGIVQTWFQDSQWYKTWTHRDLVILSRFEIIDDASFISSGRTMVALLNTENEFGKNILIFNSHLSCCDNDESRQHQVDEFSSLWREWVQNNNGPFAIEVGTPFLHLGDFNFVGFNQQIKTLKFGDIVNENEYGGDFFPDWDGTHVVDLFSRHNQKRMGYTWRNDSSSFNPGKLDYIFYSNATLNIEKHYILNTLSMDQDDLINNSLNRFDTKLASDHLPIIADLIYLDNNVKIKDNFILPYSIHLYPNAPNPFNPKTTIKYFLERDALVKVTVYDIMGKNIIRLVNNFQNSGYHYLEWDAINFKGEDVSAGVYICVLETETHQNVQKMILIK